jgi:hypothetical protein
MSLRATNDLSLLTECMIYDYYFLQRNSEALASSFYIRSIVLL